MIPELENATAEMERSIQMLRKSSCDGWVAELELLLALVRGTDHYAQKEALYRVGVICHPKALGDNQITGTDFYGWQAQVERLHDACAKAFNVLGSR